tara:strand:+ start:1543 stop:2658 length:1116 start_codon:yes stop_codon:yes gene_type:complete
MSENKILIVGAFPNSKKNIYGGVLTSCKIILQSSLANRFKINTLNSTQISNPPPNLFIRSIFGISRIFKLFFFLIFKKPKAILIFVSHGASALEKGVMILISNFFNCPSLIFPRAGKLIDQTSNSIFFHRVVKYLFNKSDVFLCQGQKWKNYAINNLKIKESNTVIVDNWTATESKIEIGNKRIINKKHKIEIIFIGWLEKHKGVFELLEAVNLLANKGYKFNLNIVGDGNCKKFVLDYIENNNLNNIVNFLGWQNSKNLNAILEKNDVFILPSWNEGMPNAMIEALAAGLAVIVTPVGVVSDYLNDGENTLFIEVKNPLSIVKALENLINNFELRKKISVNGHKLAKNKFSSEKSLTKIGNVIEGLILNN